MPTPNAWRVHVENERKANPGKPYKQVLIDAKGTYTKKSPSSSSPPEVPPS